MAEPARRLHVVDTETGEVVDPAGAVQLLEDEVAGLQHTIRSQAATITKLKRDKDAEARGHELWPMAVKLFRYWQRKTGSRAKFDADRFFLIRPMLEKDGPELCQRAIDGRVHDHFSAPRKNGTVKHFWEWDRIFASRKEFEDSACRAPLPYEPEPLEPEVTK